MTGDGSRGSGDAPSAVERARELLADALPGPWVAVENGPEYIAIRDATGFPVVSVDVVAGEPRLNLVRAEAALIAAAPELLAGLIAEVERLRAERDAVRAMTETTWMTVCSRHQHYDPDCDICQHGQWVERADLEASQALFEADPDEWRRQANASPPWERS